MRSRNILATLAISFFILAFWSGHGLKRPPIKTDKQTETVTFQANVIKLFSVGLKRAIGDAIWVQTLMESDLEHYKAKDLNSWLYLRFLSIVQLDPNFYEAYRYGGQYLMIVKDDLVGANDLMNKGLSFFPTDYHLNWQLGFLHAIEKQDPASSFVYFDKIKNHPLKPAFFDSFFTKILAQSFGANEAFQVAFELWKKYPDGDQTKDRLSRYLYSLKAKIDLDCLNGNLTGCQSADFNGTPYLHQNGEWFAAEKVEDLKLKYNNKGEP
jgi:hypothetical protein